MGQEQLKIRTGFLIQKIILDNKCGHPTFGVDAIEKHFGDAGAFAETKSTEPGLYENKCLGKQLIAV